MTLELREQVLPARGPRIVYKLGEETVLEREPGDPPEEVRGQRLLATLAGLSDARGRRDTLRSTGERIGEWLFGAAGAHLFHGPAVRSSERLRLELVVPAAWDECPFELCVVPQLEPLGLPLGVHRRFAVSRRTTQKRIEPVLPPVQLVVEVTAGWTENPAPSSVKPVSDNVVIEVAQCATATGGRGKFSVSVEPRAVWAEMQHRYKTYGPPHVVHWLGQPSDDGTALLFYDADQKADAVDASLLAALLSDASRHRQSLLLVLVGASPFCGPRQFAVLNRLFAAARVPFILTAPLGLAEWEQRLLADKLYRCVANGDSPEWFVQEAREALYEDSRAGFAWALLSLISTAPLGPLYRDRKTSGAPSATLMDFGHEAQRQRLTRFLKRSSPLVVVVHGELGRAHGHVTRRVQADLEANGSILWRPVATMDWFHAGSPALKESQLMAAIARSLNLRDNGSVEELLDRLVTEIASRCASGRVIVIELRKPVVPESQDEAEALVVLVQRLFSSLMQRVTLLRTAVPVFLMLPIAYPRRPNPRDKQAKATRQAIEHTQRAVERIGQKKKLEGQVHVEVVEELKQFERGYVAEYLVDTLNIDEDRADTIAERFTAAGADNETILDHMQHLLETWKEA